MEGINQMSKKLTKREIKKVVKDIESVIEQSLPDVPRFNQPKQKINKELSYEAILKETMNMVERNTPKKPITKKFVEICPSCNQEVHNKNAHLKTYCEFCGQAIDWEDIIKTLKEYDNE
jgi:predicted RNA-binding Zn-ribbon protein involved in translation (DUF1610 family)